jgi:hypothetical protein
MKMYFIAMLIVCINLGFALIGTALGFTGSSGFYDHSLVSGWETRVKALSGDTGGMQEPDDPARGATGDSKKAMSLMEVLLSSVFPHILLEKTFGFPATLVWIICIPIYGIYLITIAQILFGFGGEGAL